MMTIKLPPSIVKTFKELCSMKGNNKEYTMHNITTYEQKINSCVCNCGRLTDWYPERGYVEFWLQEPDGKYLLRDIDEVDSESPYDAIERHIDDGVFAYSGRDFGGSPVFILAAFGGQE